MGQHLPQTTMQVLPGSSCLGYFPRGPTAHSIRVFGFLPPHPCSPGLSDTALPRRWQFYTPIPSQGHHSSSSFCIYNTGNTFLIRSIRRAAWAHKQDKCQLPSQAAAITSPSILGLSPLSVCLVGIPQQHEATSILAQSLPSTPTHSPEPAVYTELSWPLPFKFNHQIVSKPPPCS